MWLQISLHLWKFRELGLSRGLRVNHSVSNSNCSWHLLNTCCVPDPVQCFPWINSFHLNLWYRWGDIQVCIIQEHAYHKAFSHTQIAVISNDSILALHDLFPWMVSVSSVPWLLSRQEKNRQCIPQHFPHYRSPFVPMQTGSIRFWIGNWSQTCRGVPPSITFTAFKKSVWP